MPSPIVVMQRLKHLLPGSLQKEFANTQIEKRALRINHRGRGQRASDGHSVIEKRMIKEGSGG